MKKRLTRLLALLMAVILFPGGCGTAPKNQEESGGQDEHARFEEFSEQLFRDELLTNTLNQHYTLAYPENYGITDYEVALPAVSLSNEQESIEEARSVLEELASFDYDALTEDDRLTYDVLKEYLETAQERGDFYYLYEPFSPIMGFQSDMAFALSEYTFRRERDVQDYLGLLELLPTYIESLITLEKERAARGLAMPDSVIDEVIDSVQELLNSGTDNIYFTSFEERLETLSELSDQQKQEYTARNRKLIDEQLLPAYKKIVLCLKDVRGTCKKPQGLCCTENGNEYYAYLLKSTVGSGHSPEELLALLEDQISKEMTELMTLLTQNPELLDTIDDSIPEDRTPEEILDYLKEAIKEDYPELPVDASYQIKYVPEYMEESTSPAFYMTPPMDLPGENTIYINKRQTDESSLFSTLAHESYPGHLYQTVYASATLENPLRFLLNYLGYSEGWGLYVEHEAYALNTNLTDQSEAMAEFYRINSSITIAIHALLDLKIHYEGCSLEEASEIIAMYFGDQGEEFCQTLYNTIVSEPAYYLKYYVGYLEFLLLREKAEAKLESAFDLKEFHKFLLDMGPCSFPMLDRYMEKWLEEQK